MIWYETCYTFIRGLYDQTGDNLILFHKLHKCKTFAQTCIMEKVTLDRVPTWSTKVKEILQRTRKCSLRDTSVINGRNM